MDFHRSLDFPDTLKFQSGRAPSDSSLVSRTTLSTSSAQHRALICVEGKDMKRFKAERGLVATFLRLKGSPVNITVIPLKREVELSLSNESEKDVMKAINLLMAAGLVPKIAAVHWFRKAELGDFVAMRGFIQQHYPLNMKNAQNETALIVAAKRRRSDIVALLLAEGAGADHQDDNGNTALHYAIQNYAVATALDILDHHADPYLRNRNGETAAQLARTQRMHEVTEKIQGGHEPSNYRTRRRGNEFSHSNSYNNSRSHSQHRGGNNRSPSRSPSRSPPPPSKVYPDLSSRRFEQFDDAGAGGKGATQAQSQRQMAGMSHAKLLQLTGFTNDKVNGLYRIQDRVVGGRPCYISTRKTILWFNERNSWWMISPESKVGSDKCYVYAYDSASDPLEVVSPWKHFDSKAPGGGEFRVDEFALILRPETTNQMNSRTADMTNPPESGFRGSQRGGDLDTFTYANRGGNTNDKNPPAAASSKRENRFNRRPGNHQRSRSEDVGAFRLGGFGGGGISRSRASSRDPPNRELDGSSFFSRGRGRVRNTGPLGRRGAGLRSASAEPNSQPIVGGGRSHSRASSRTRDSLLVGRPGRYLTDNASDRTSPAEPTYGFATASRHTMAGAASEGLERARAAFRSRDDDEDRYNGNKMRSSRTDSPSPPPPLLNNANSGSRGFGGGSRHRATNGRFNDDEESPRRRLRNARNDSPSGRQDERSESFSRESSYRDQPRRGVPARQQGQRTQMRPSQSRSSNHFNAPNSTTSSSAAVGGRRGPGPRVDPSEFQRLRFKHQGGIFCTKYPFGKMIFGRAKPKKTRIEVDVGENGPRLTWGTSPRKEAALSEFQSVTLGIKSDVFRRFENKMMRTTDAQPNQCLSIHGKTRTVDLVLSSPQDAQDLKKYLDAVMWQPQLLTQ